MKISDVIGIRGQDLRGLSVPEIQKITSYTVRMANKRLRELNKRKMLKTTPIYESIRGSLRDDRVPIRSVGASRAQLLYSLKLAQRVLRAQTSTVTGAKKYQAKIDKLLGTSLSPRENRAFWDMVNNVRNNNELLMRVISSDRLIQMGIQLWHEQQVKRNFNMMVNELERRMENEYERAVEFYNNY